MVAVRRPISCCSSLQIDFLIFCYHHSLPQPLHISLLFLQEINFASTSLKTISLPKNKREPGAVVLVCQSCNLQDADVAIPDPVDSWRNQSLISSFNFYCKIDLDYASVSEARKDCDSKGIVFWILFVLGLWNQECSFVRVPPNPAGVFSPRKLF